MLNIWYLEGTKNRGNEIIIRWNGIIIRGNEILIFEN